MDRKSIIARTRVKMDEMVSGPSSQVVEEPTLDIILDETVDQLLQMVPRYLIIPKTFAAADIVHGENALTGYVVLPTDFLRLYSFKMTEWLRPVTDVISQDHPDFVLQGSSATMGKIAKPVCVIRYELSKTKFVLDYFSVKTVHTIDHALYIPVTKAEDLQENLIPPLTWLLVAKAFQIYSNDEQAQAKAMGQVQNWINLNTR